MDQQRFTEILKEYDFSAEQIQRIWDARPSDDLPEDQVRATAEHIAPRAKREQAEDK